MPRSPDAEQPVVAVRTVPIAAEPTFTDDAELVADLQHVPVESATIPILQEEISVEKVQKNRSSVFVHVVPSEREEVVSVPVTDVNTEIKRVKIGRFVDAAPPIREEGDTVIVPVLEEVLVVEKRLMLREEIHLQRSATTRVTEQRVKVRSEHVEITRVEHGSDSKD